MTLDETKEVVAIEYGYLNWMEIDVLEQRDIWSEVCKRYAIEVAKAALLRASENIMYMQKRVENYTSIAPKYTIEVYKPSITDESNITLL